MNSMSEMSSCPYNPNHTFEKYKLFSHIQRCKEAKKSRKRLMYCKKDSTIMFFSDGRKSHLSVCKYCSGTTDNSITADLGVAIKEKIEKIKSQKILSDSISLDLSLTDNLSEVQHDGMMEKDIFQLNKTNSMKEGSTILY